MSKIFVIIVSIAVCMVFFCGCSNVGTALARNTSAKNVDLAGLVMLGEIETASPESGTPQGRLIMGRVTYKSRKVGIPADQKVPNTGYFKACRTETIFGTKETSIEYDFTAGTKEEAAETLNILEKHRKEAEKNLGL